MWYDLGLRLGQPSAELDGYKVLTLTESSKYPCCQRVFSRWMENADDEGDYPVTWNGVYQLLRDMERAGLATKLEEALSFRGVTIDY